MSQLSEDTRTRVLERDYGRCSGRFLGGECSAILDMHHILRRSEGGSDEDSNLLTLCKSHHRYLEVLRDHILEHRERLEEACWRRCPHGHRTPEAREQCERRLNRRRHVRLHRSHEGIKRG